MSILSADSAAATIAPTERGSSFWVWAALVVAATGLGGSLYLSWGMGLKACPLCFYQRTFLMSLVAVLGVGLAAGTAQPGRLGLLTLPLATAGLGVALFHVWLVVSDKLECPQGILGLGTAPGQSLAVYLLLFALLLADVLLGKPSGPRTWLVLASVLVLGGLLAVASCTSNPPMPPPPPTPYAGPPEVCRPPSQAR
jgi:disulfide bond formation protein DsbB